jgi:NodT family efflux transporter outer membrane factor (OMF) lipoprotein
MSSPRDAFNTKVQWHVFGESSHHATSGLECSANSSMRARPSIDSAGSKRVASRAFPLLLSLLLAGCITPPKISPVEKPVDHRIDLGLGSMPAPVQKDWWTAYQDPQLDRLIDAALTDNPTLRQALARLQQAQAVVDGARADLWPYVSYDASVNREQISGKAAIPPQYQGASVWLSQELVNFSWTLDFWGRQASLVRQVRNQADAVALDEAAARLAIVSAVVRTYIDLERSYELADVARREEQQREQILEITRHRFGAGLDTNVELRQAAGAVPQARVERLADEAAIDRDVHLLAALSGRGADEFAAIQRPKLHAETVLSLPTALPMDLLARRPDVLATRIRISAARAGLAAAKADFYPNINLLAFGGTIAAGQFTNLFQGRAASYGVGPALNLPLFDAGRLKANYRANVADIDLALTAYNDAVLRAVQETADQLSDLASLNTSLTQQQESLDDAEAAFRLATERYSAGLTTYLVVLTTETQVLDARRQRVNLESARASARVTLLIDVGGDFRLDSPATAANAGR